MYQNSIETFLDTLENKKYYFFYYHFTKYTIKYKYTICTPDYTFLQQSLFLHNSRFEYNSLAHVKRSEFER